MFSKNEASDRDEVHSQKNFSIVALPDITKLVLP
jgi:hypothetical protein